MAASMAFTASVHAGTATWASTSNANWTDVGAWTGAPPATDGSDSAAFNYLATSSITSTIDSAWATAGTVSGITFGGSDAVSNAYTLKLGTGVTSLTIGAGGINSSKTLGSITLDATSYTAQAINLGADQTWTVSGGTGNGSMSLKASLAGSGNLTKSGSGRLLIDGAGNSTGWTGVFTLYSGEVRLTGSNATTKTAALSRLGTSMNWSNPTGSANQTQLSFDGNGTFATNIAFTDAGDRTYNFGNSSGAASNVTISGNMTGALSDAIVFQADPTSGQIYRLSGNNSGLTSSITSTSSTTGAVWVRNATVYVDSANALGTNNSLFTVLGESSSATAGRTAGLLTKNGVNVSAQLKANINTNASAVAEDVTIGLDGTGSASFTGNVILGSSNTASNKAANVKLSAVSGGAVTFSGVISDQSAANTNKVSTISVQGGGQVILTGNNTYAAQTDVLSGTTLLVSNTEGSGTGTGNVTVSGSGAVLGGTGTIAPTGANGITVSSGAFLAPGASIGTLTVNLSGTTGTVSMLSGSAFKFELAAANETIGSIAAGSSDLLALTGAAAGDFAFNSNNIDFLGTGSAGYYKLFSSSLLDASTWTGLTFNGTTGVVSAGLTYSGLNGGLSSGEFIVGTASNGGTVGDIYFHAVPEPATWLLLTFGLTAGVILRRRRA